MKTKKMPLSRLRKLQNERYKKQLDTAKYTANVIENKLNDQVNFVFPCFIYNQVKRAFR